MKPSNTNSQLPGLSRNTRRAHSLSRTEIGLDASHNIPSPLGEEGEEFFLDIPSYRTHQGGYAAFESNDGKKLYYSRLEGGGIWTVPVNGGVEEQITDALHHGYWGHFSVVDSGIYFLDADAKPGPTILFYDFRFRRTVPVYTLTKSPLPWGASLAASR